MPGRAEFDDDWLVELRSIIGGHDGLPSLRAELLTIGARYRSVIEGTPCDLPGAPYNKSLTQRIAWLDAQVLAPCERLLAALGDDQGPMFSTWPYEDEFPHAPDRAAVRESVIALSEFADRLRRNLRGEQEMDAGTNQEIRAAIFYDVDDAVKRHLPHLEPSRGVYDAVLKRYIGKYPEAMRHIYREITGLDEQLVRLIDSSRSTLR